MTYIYCLIGTAKESINDTLKLSQICRRRTIVNSCILPILTYGVQTRALTKQMMIIEKKRQRVMERHIIGITIRDRKRKLWIRNQPNEIDGKTKMWKLLSTMNESGTICEIK